MAAGGLIAVLTKMVIRSAVKTGLHAALRNDKPQAGMTPEERQEANSAKSLAQKVRKLARLGRRLFR